MIQSLQKTVKTAGKPRLFKSLSQSSVRWAYICVYETESSAAAVFYLLLNDLALIQ